MSTIKINVEMSTDAKKLIIYDLSTYTDVNGEAETINSRVFTIINLYDKRSVTVDLADLDASFLSSWTTGDKYVEFDSEVLGFTAEGATATVLPDAVWFIKYNVNTTTKYYKVMDIGRRIENTEGLRVVVNGNTYTQSFITDSNETMADFATVVDADADVLDAFVVDEGDGTDDDRKIKFEMSDSAITFTGAMITNGGGGTALESTVTSEGGVTADQYIENTIISYYNTEICEDKNAGYLVEECDCDRKKKMVRKYSDIARYKRGAIALHKNSEYAKAQTCITNAIRLCSYNYCYNC